MLWNKKKIYLDWNEYSKLIQRIERIRFIHSTAVASYNNLVRRGDFYGN